MPRQYVKELKDGDSVDEVYLLAEKQLRANRNAALYLLATLKDRTGMISGLMWNVTEDRVAHFDAGDLVRVKGKAQLYQGNLQLILTHVDRVPSNGVDWDEFQAQPSRDAELHLARVREILLSIDDPPLRTLMECFLVDEDLVDLLMRAPAGIKVHHAYQGGLIEHIATMLEMARRIEDLYPEIDINLLLAGIFLHDLGKVREMEFGQTFAYTDEGQLLGHMLIAVQMLDQKIAQVREMTGQPFPEETVLRLKHMIISHHGSYESGSPKLPMTPEAIALHHLDNLDAKVHEFAETIDSDPNRRSHWTPYISRIERKLFKGNPDGGNSNSPS